MEGVDVTTSRPDALWYEEESRILLCLTCKRPTALRPGPAGETHFRNVHRWKGDELKEVVSYIATLELSDPHTTTLPRNGSRAIPQLTVDKGYSCNGCAYLTSSRKKIVNHYRTAQHPMGEERWKEVKLQTYSQGRCARYWMVDDGEDGASRGRVRQEDENGREDEDEDESEGENGDGDGDEWMRTLREYDEVLERKREERFRVVENPWGVENVSTWVKEIGWAEHLEGKRMDQLHEASLMPKARERRSNGNRREIRPGDKQLIPLGESFNRVIERCIKRMKLVPHETLRWLNGVDPNKPAGDPFKVKEMEETMCRYKLFWQRYLCYAVRACRLGREEAVEQRGIRFNDRQWELIERVTGWLDEEDEVMEEEEKEEWQQQLDQDVFEFCIGSLKQKVPFKVYINPLLHFAAVLGINERGLRWKQAKDYTGQLAGIIWCARVLMLEHIFKDESEEPEEITVDMVERFKEEYRIWLADGSNTPFSTMLRWMSYGKGFRTKEGGAAKVLWEEEGETLRYLGQRIEVQDFRKAVNAQVDEAERLMNELMFNGWEEAKGLIDLRRIEDSLMLEGRGDSFVTNDRNSWLRPGHRFLAQKGKTTLWRPARGWRLKSVADYLKVVQAFRRVQLGNVHIWGGQPGRGPEIMTIKHCDTQQVIRNVFVFDGQVLIITDRDKSRAIRGIGRKVARFLPERVGKLMIAHIAWVMPFEQLLHEQSKIPGPSPSLEAYLWKDGKKKEGWKTEQLSEQLASITGKFLGVELTVRDYRHVAIVLGRVIKGIVIRQLEVEMGEQQGDDGTGGDAMTGESREARFEYVWDLQATHGSAIARGHYGVDVRFPNQLQPEMISNYREISNLWHRWLIGGRRQQESGRVEKRKERPDEGIMEVREAKRQRREGALDDIVQKDAVQEEEVQRDAVQEDEVQRDAVQEEEVQRDAVQEQEVQKGLKRLLGPQAEWKTTEQGAAMERIMKMKKAEMLIVVLPTGGGKSVLFQLPGLLKSTGTSVVVVPFLALMEDLVERAQKAGIDCIRWKPQTAEGRDGQARVAKMVVVSADLASCEEFTMYMDSLRAREMLGRIFIDEGHTIIMDVGYRKKLEALKGLNRFDCPMILLTATLPVRMERWFRKAMLAEQASIIRAETTKRNIRYRVVRVKRRDEVQEEVIRVVLRLEKGMEGDQKGVVYCRSKEDCELLAEKLGCDFYHAGITDEKVRKERLQRWIKGEGNNRWIVATTALGTGIDIPGVVGIVHMEQPYGLVDFVQQTGRGGRREGEVMESVVVMDERRAWRNQTSGDIEQLNNQAMDWFVESVDCRRVSLGVFMEGEGKDCQELEAERCDRCRVKERRVEEGEEREETGDEVGGEVGDGVGGEMRDEVGGNKLLTGSNRLRKDVKEKVAGLERLRKWLERVKGHCGVCYVKWCQQGQIREQKGGFRHGMERCKVIKKDEYVTWRDQVVFGKYGCCWTCGVPQMWCPGLGSGVCEYMNQVIPVMMMVGKSSRLRELVKEEFGIEAMGGSEGEGRYVEWIGRSRRMYGENMTNGLAVWDLIVRRVCDG